MSPPSMSTSRPDPQVTANGVAKSPNVCWRYMQGSYCPEELCHYQHGPPLDAGRLPRRSAASYGPTACLFFAQGYCKHGERCTFAHIPLSTDSAQHPDNADRSSAPAAGTGESYPPQTQARRVTVHETGSRDAQTGTAMKRSQSTWSAAEPEHSVVNSKQYLDKHRSRQVYDDNKVLVLSGGVMLGRPDGEEEGVPANVMSPTRNKISRASATQLDAEIYPSPMHPYPIPAIASPNSAYSPDYVFTPGEWPSAPDQWVASYDDPRAVALAPGYPAPEGMAGSWASYSFPPHTTTITMNPPRPPTNRKTRRAAAAAQRIASYEPLPPTPETELVSNFSALQLDVDPYTSADGYVSDGGGHPSSFSSESPPSPSSPLRRSSLGAVVELERRREAVNKAIVRDPHATHRRNRPSM
ncbi:hypothetical protein DL93DRAFT_2168705 [Clavulina sp. PMI_390]|nr:hypothetical protein DL93DRAFT_2168705 [Clavulina sp. PMI_390]